MEEFKFYSVKIGTRTRAGNINIAHSFVAQSEKDQNSVYTFYSSKYNGLSVEVSQITEIVKDEIPAVKSYNPYEKSPEKKKIEELELELENLKKGSSPIAFDRFSGKLDKDSSVDIKLLYKEWKVLHEEYYKKRDEIKVLAKKLVGEKYNKDVQLYYVEILEFTHKDSEIPFTVRLEGKILPANNIIK